MELIKFLDRTVVFSDELLSKLYVAMSDVHKIDNWHQYMTNPLPISSFECLYDWEDVVRNRNFAKNSKFTVVDKHDQSYVHYTITPLEYNPYYNNSVKFTFTNGEFRMERWFLIRPNKKDKLNVQERENMLKHHANGIFSKITTVKIDGDTLRF